MTTTRIIAVGVTILVWIVAFAHRPDMLSAGEAPTSQSATRPTSYSTTFDGTENPISEHATWHRADNTYTNVQTENGIAHGTNGKTDTYDDSYALLTGFAPDQYAQAVVQRSDKPIKDVTHEVLLLLRFADNKDGARGYECLFSHSGGVQIVRWNGKMGDYTVLKSDKGPEQLGRQLATGDVIKASIVGAVITVSINDQLIARTRDTTYADGQPGIGFFIRPGGNSADFAITSYSVTSEPAKEWR